LGILHCREEDNGGSLYFLFSNTYWVFTTAESKKMEYLFSIPYWVFSTAERKKMEAAGDTTSLQKRYKKSDIFCMPESMYVRAQNY
jgi:hypothetical protein